MNVKKVVGSIIAAASTAAVAVGAKYLCDVHLYDSDGYNKKGYDKNGFNKEGYDKYGYDQHGFDRNGYDKDGYDFQGYDKEGYDSYGFDCEGFDRDGFDKTHRDREGYNKSGYDKEGYDRTGKDRCGYYRSGYNSNGFDRGYMSPEDYTAEVIEIEKSLQEAHVQMKIGKFGYALRDIRIGLEKSVKCIILHWLGEAYIREKLDANITVCKRMNLLSDDFIDKLYSAKNHCNDMQHDNSVEKNYDQVHFAYKVLEELKEEIKSFI